MTDRIPLLTRLDLRLKRPLVRLYNAILRFIPFSIKYRLGSRLRRRIHPYRNLGTGDTVVLIGSARDILLAGRSRAMHSAMIVGPSGRIIVLEADPGSCAALRDYAHKHRVSQITVIGKGAWRSCGRLRFLTNPRHPAANRLAGFVTAGVKKDDFEGIEIDVDSIDNILRDNRIDGPIRLVSVTTNGSELDVLKGLGETARRCDYISVARAYRTPDVGEKLLAMGFSEVAIDDRGILFRRQDLVLGA
ncbi:MAG: FkbM family methyltransferase [Burkholderiales bacterium]